ncbi:hypothetical protein AC95_5130, partial [Escherichia coli 2-052-05_S4_C2]
GIDINDFFCFWFSFFILSWHYKKALLINLLQRTGHYQSK